MGGSRHPLPPSCRTLWYRIGAATLIVVLVHGGASRASEESLLRTNDGLVKFHAGQYRDALASFDSAVAADANDLHALYYRGVTYARLGEYQRTIDDLNTVVSRGPEQDEVVRQAVLELGIALVDAKRYREAIPWLQRAQRTTPLEAQASFYLGLAQFQLEEYDAALPNLKQGEASPQLRVASRYYQGVIRYRTTQWPAAVEDFTFVATATPEAQMGVEAKKFLELMGAGRRYVLHAGFALEYDSNVLLAPSNEQDQVAFGITDEADGRAVVTAGAGYMAVRTPRLQLSLGYDFYQSIYFQLTDFDLQDHRPSATLIVQTDYAQFGLLGQYDFELLGADSLLQQVIAAPWTRVPEGDFGHTEVFYRLRYQDYFQSRFEALDALNHAIGARQYVYLGQTVRYLWAGYRFDLNNSDLSGGDQFSYDGNQVEVGIGATLPWIDADADLSYWFRHEDYASASNGRVDNENSLALVVLRPLTEYLRLRGAYYGTWNDSNQSVFTYDRNIVSLGLEVIF